jgi:hypothetical protein
VIELSERAKKALDRARERPLSYAVRVLRAPDGRALAILGEAHLKLKEASEIGREVVESFELRGVETFQRDRIFAGRTLGVLIHVPRLLLRWLSFGSVRDSTITDAKQLPSGHTVEIERTKHVPFGLHVTSAYMAGFFGVSFAALAAPLLTPIAPWLVAAILALASLFQAHMVLLVPAIVLRRQPWSWVVHPFLGILTLRDELMTSGTVQMLADHPEVKEAVIVMGRAHVSGVERLLVEHGFTRE